MSEEFPMFFAQVQVHIKHIRNIVDNLIILNKFAKKNFMIIILKILLAFTSF